MLSDRGGVGDEPETVTVIPEEGSNVNRSYSSESNTIFQAIKSRRIDLVKQALFRYRACVNECDALGFMPIFRAIHMKSCEMENLLLAHGADVNQSVDGETPYIAAVKANCPDIVDVLVAHGAKECDVTALCKAVLPNDRHTRKGHPLYNAAFIGNLVLVRRLLLSNDDVTSSKASRSYHALFAAIAGGHVDVLKLLLAHGVDVNHPTGTDTPLAYAVRLNKHTEAELLLAAGADVNCSKDDSGSPLYEAVSTGSTDKLQLL